MYISPEYKENKYKSLNFTWTYVSMQAKEMEFQLEFESPIDISPFLPYDTLYFTTSDKFFMPNLTLSSNIKPQIKSSNITTTSEKLGQTAETMMKSFTGMNFVLAVWLQGILNQLLGVIQSLSIVVHFPLLNVPLPAIV